MSEGEEELNVGAVRLEEVASAANVSLSTASKALRGKPHVSEKTRIRGLMLRGGWVIAPQKLWHRWQG